jgi:hypothetical protein
MSGMHQPPRTTTRPKAMPFRRAILAGVSVVTGLVSVLALTGAQEPLADHELARSTRRAAIPAIDTLSTRMTALVESDVAIFETGRSERTRPARRKAPIRSRRAIAPQPPPVVAPPPPPAPAYGDPYSYATWDQLASCESGGDWAIDTGNGFYGGLQFTLESWQGVGGPAGYPHQFSRETQIQIAMRLWEIQGWDAWPSCSSQLGYQ